MSHKTDYPTEIPSETDEADHVTRGADGFARSLRVAAFLPLVLLSGVVVGRVGLFDDGSTPAESASHSSSLVVDSRTPSLDQLPDTGHRKHHQKAGDKLSDEPTSEATPSEAASPTQAPPSTPTSSPSTPSSSPSPTKSPTKSPSPSPTPTPEDARQQCVDEGVNPLDLDAMAECIAAILHGG